MAPSSIRYAASSRVSPTRAATMCFVIASSAVTASRSAPWATCDTTSRSEMMPMGRCTSPTTSAPTLSTHIACETARSVWSGRANTAPGARDSQPCPGDTRASRLLRSCSLSPRRTQACLCLLRPRYQCDADARPRDRAESPLLRVGVPGLGVRPEERPGRCDRQALRSWCGWPSIHEPDARSGLGCLRLGLDHEAVALVPGHGPGIAGHQKARLAEGIHPGQSIGKEEAPDAGPAPVRVDGNQVDVPMGCGGAPAVDPAPEPDLPLGPTAVRGEGRAHHGVDGLVVVAGPGREPGRSAGAVLGPPQPSVGGELAGRLEELELDQPGGIVTFQAPPLDGVLGERSGQETGDGDHLVNRSPAHEARRRAPVGDPLTVAGTPRADPSAGAHLPSPWEGCSHIPGDPLPWHRGPAQGAGRVSPGMCEHPSHGLG